MIQNDIIPFQTPSLLGFRLRALRLGKYITSKPPSTLVHAL